jgi:nitroimidazol reductase NimA-like FMN-containing flavoprotein (pyridoxamine 5'-phosphate oxidase superfamily)
MSLRTPSWLHPMRRQDREIVDSERIWDILVAAEVCRVAFSSEGWPYIVPLNFGILDGKLYFHSASAGTKLELLAANPNVCFEVEANVKIQPGDRACSWSVRYQSVIGFGHASLVEDPDERRAGLKALITHYGDAGAELPQQLSPETSVFRIDVHALYGKESTGS